MENILNLQLNRVNAYSDLVTFFLIALLFILLAILFSYTISYIQKQKCSSTNIETWLYETKGEPVPLCLKFFE